MSGLHGHGRPRHGLLTRAAEAVDGDTWGLHGPAGGQHRHATDACAVIAGVVAVADDHVVHVGGVESDAGLQALQNLGQQLLRMDVVQGTGVLALAARAAHSVDDPSFGHGDSPRQ